MSACIPSGCELTPKGRSNLKEAIRCLLLAGMTLAGSHAVPVFAQQSVTADNDLRATTLESIEVFGFMVHRESFMTTPVSINFGNATLYIDGVRQDFYPGPLDTHSYETPTETVSKNPQPDCSVLKNNPVDVSAGTKHFHEVDFQSISNPELKLSRYRNPAWTGTGILGKSWITNFDVKIATDTCDQLPGKPSCEISASSGAIRLYTERGGLMSFAKLYNSNDWTSENGGVLERLNDGSGAYLLNLRGVYNSPRIKFRRNGQIEQITNSDGNNLVYTYDSANRLTRVTHSSGRSIVFAWTASTPGAVTSITAPNGATYGFEYYFESDGRPILRKVNFPDGKANVEYLGAHLVTQIKIDGQPFKNYTYYETDPRYAHGGLSAGLVASSSFVDGTNPINYTYHKERYPEYLFITRTETVDGYGKKTTYLLEDQMLVETIGDASVHCSATAKKATYNSDKLLESTTDESGVTTRYEYDSRRRKVRQIEALGTSQQRTTTWEWDHDPSNALNNFYLHNELIKKITVEGHSSITYGYNGELLSSITRNDLMPGSPNAPQTVTFTHTFHPNGLIASIVQDGPLEGAGDSKKMFYSEMGDLISVENSLGQVQTFSMHNGFGQPGRIVDIAGAVTEYEYDARGRIVLERRFPNGSPVETRYIYGSSGLLDAITSTDGSAVYRHYDVAHRLIQEDRTQPGGGYEIKRYTYDVMSNPIKIEVGRDN